MFRLINYFIGFIVIYLFILEAGMQDHAIIITGLTLSVLVAFIAFFGNWITLDATKAVILLGTIVLGFAGWITAFAVLFFFISGSLLTRKRRVSNVVEDIKRYLPQHLQKRRDGYQVWANGFWLAMFCIGWFIFTNEAYLVAAFAALATATADTWATEMGTIKPGKTIKITTLKVTDPGTDGGISLKGTAAAIVGSLVISSVLIFGNLAVSGSVLWIVFLFGIAGCFIDSVIGGLFSDRNITINIPNDYSGSRESFTNSFVNWASTGISGLLALITAQLLL